MRGPVELSPLVLAEHCTVSARVTVRLGREVVADSIPVLSGVLESSLRRDSQDRVTLRFSDEWLPRQPWDALQAYGQVSQLFVDVDRPGRPTVSVNMGFFKHDSGGPVRGSMVEVVAFGLLVELGDDPFPFPTSPVKGATVAREFGRLASPHLDVDAGGVGGRVLPDGLAWGTDRLRAVHDLNAGQGTFCRVESDGVLHVYGEDVSRLPVVSYSTGDLLLGAPSAEWRRSANVFTAIGESQREVKDSEGESETVTDQWVASASSLGVRAPESYGVVRELLSVQSSASAVSVRGAADAALRDSLLVADECSFEMVPDPRLQVGDVAEFVFEGPGGGLVVLVARVVGLSFDLVSVAAGSMRCDVEVLSW